MLNGAEGQGLTTYESVGISNHLDYSSWNNHMRAQSTGPVFQVLGAAWGLPNLFTATHRIFEESTIHYSEICDLLKVVDGELTNSTDVLVCWPGQQGGLEGLRQKRLESLELFDTRKGVQESQHSSGQVSSGGMTRL